jgi:DNA helicase-2/ATP-dependent DNA helicase PcrA
MDYDFISWAQLLVGLGVYSTNSAARQVVRQMMQIAMTPADVLCYDNSTYVAEFMNTYEKQDIVVFDTETTGLDVFNDDVVQIAAVRVRQGRVVDELNIFLQTDKPIPAMLGDVANPLVEEYKQHKHLSPAEGLSLFCQFAKGSAILGHNATYDYQIMEHNMRHYAPSLSMKQLWPSYFDTLKLAHLLHPRQPSYKLRDLLVQLHLEGQNSHLANDDILATLSLATECYDRARSIVGRQLEFISRHRKALDRLRNLYGDLYHRTIQALYVPCDNGSPLCDAISQAYNYFLGTRIMPPLPKLRYLLNYVSHQLTTPSSGHSLAEHLARHYTDLTTLKEADLCGSDDMDERVFVSTVHKAKGLEFDTVFVYAAVEGRYPSTYATSDESIAEEARKFYVALSRARRRLIISYSLQTTTPWGRTFQNKLTPFMESIAHFFEQQWPNGDCPWQGIA